MVVGHPVAHSLSPVMHRAAFEALQISARYLAPFDLNPDEAEDMVGMMRRFHFRQLAVTIPYKETALRIADEASEVATRIGAANTLTRLEDNRVIADNTDWIGVRDAIIPLRPWSGKRAHILGAGGAARAVIHALQAEDMAVSISNRSSGRTAQLVREFGIQEGDPTEPCDLLVNVTPVGMHLQDQPDNVAQTPFPTAHLRPEMTVFDTIPNPVETRLLREAKAAGCKTIDGLQMLVAQGIEQLKIWTSVIDASLAMQVEAQREVLADCMRQAALRQLQAPRPVR